MCQIGCGVGEFEETSLFSLFINYLDYNTRFYLTSLQKEKDSVTLVTEGTAL